MNQTMATATSKENSKNDELSCITVNLHFNLRFDSSVGRGDFATSIGTGQVIKGRLAAYYIRITIDKAI
jgi:hypothetical protein